MILHSENASVETQGPFELKGSLFTLTVMHLYHADNAAIERHLGAKAKQAPEFFNNAPVVIDLGSLTDPNTSIDFTRLYDLLRKRGMIPVGVRNGIPELQAAAELAGLPILPEGRAIAGKKNDKLEPAPRRRSRMMTQPVRSGQQIYAADSDLILLGSVSPGAEVLADGNIHIYAPLRGRALAGVKGDTEARIFCQSLEAELVAIAGRYRLMEQQEAAIQGKFVQLYLSEEDRLIIEPLER